MTKLWREWVNITKKFASLLASIILILAYFLLIIPIALIIKVFVPKALLGHGYQQKKQSFWIKKRSTKQDLNFAKQQ